MSLFTPFENDERRAFRQSVRRFTEAEITPFADEWDEAGAFPSTLHEKAGSLGLFGFGIDEAYGGNGLDDAFMRAALAEEIAMCGAGGIAANLMARNISTGPIAKLGDESLKQAILPDVLAGRKASSLAITEPSGGSDVAALSTTAKPDGSDYLINGQKTFITGGMIADFYVVGARTGNAGLAGISLFIVPADASGFNRTALDKKMGWWASDTATLYFDDVRVAANQMLGPKDRGFIAIMENFNYERLGMMAQCLGMMKAVYQDATAYANERHTFGKPLIGHQVIRHKLVGMSMRIDMIESYLNQICATIEQGHMPVAEIAKGKVASTQALLWVANEGMQTLGGAGYLRGNRIERIYREVKVMAIGGGSEEVMMDLAFKQMQV